MAMVQAMPIASEHQGPESGTSLQTSASSPVLPDTMGSVGSLVSGRNYHDKHCKATEYSSKCRKANQIQNIFRQQDGHLKNGYSQDCIGGMVTKKQSGNYTQLKDDRHNGGWNMMESPASPCSDPEDVQEGKSVNGNIRGPPPKIIPVSGKLEKNIEKNLIRPTAFKPVMPKNRSSVQYFVPRTINGLSDSQGSLNIVFNGNSLGSIGCAEKRNSLQSYGCSRSSAQSGTLSDSGRNSAVPCCQTASRSWGSASSRRDCGRGRPSCGSCGRAWRRTRRPCARSTRRSSGATSRRRRSCGRAAPAGCGRAPSGPSGCSRCCSSRCASSSRRRSSCRRTLPSCFRSASSSRRSAPPSRRSRLSWAHGWRRPSGRFARSLGRFPY